jgi:hypothetical protein
VLLVGAALLSAACRNDTAPVPETRFTLPDSVVVSWGDTATLRSASSTLPAGPIIWRSTDSTVASVDSTGLVAAHRGGAVLITATAGDVVASTKVVVDIQFASLSVGSSQTCGLTRAGRALCWGVLPAIAVIDSARRFAEIVVSTGNISYAAQGETVCARVRDGGAECWGANNFGHRGAGVEYTGSPGADSVHLAVGLTAIRAGTGHMCAVTVDANVFCWGDAESGQLGSPVTTRCSVSPHSAEPCSGIPTQVPLNAPVKELASGDQTSCAITTGGGIYCWGAAIAPGEPSGPLHLLALPAGMMLHGLVLGSAHACGLTADGQAVCWGRDDSGQLGLGASDTITHAPTPMGSALRFMILSASGNNTCGVATSGAVYCWGANFYGQIGDGTTIDRAAPSAAKLGPAMVSVSTADSRTCALAADGEAYCWGATSLGNGGSFYGSTFPVRVAPPL